MKAFIVTLFSSIPTVCKKIFRTWITGVIYLLAFAGYMFYGILWLLRFMQSLKKKTILIPAASIIAAVFVYYILAPVGQNEKTVEFHISPGTSLKFIAQSLEKKHVITWSTALVLWMRLGGTAKRIQAGIVEFKEHEGVIIAAKKLLNAKPVEYTVTVPEGLTVEQTAGIFHAALKIDSARFVSLCQDTGFSKIIGDSLKSCEGYLCPDTYRFPEKTTCADILRKMFNHFEESFEKLQPAPNDGGGQLSKRQIVILASIVEKEARLSAERPRIAAVFYNRLRLGMPLGADPTVRFIFRKFSGPLRVSELKFRSPYNTRIFSGLPPGPICSPGFASLQAVMAPIKSRELYFVAKWDGSGAHDFSETYQEHNKKKDTIQRKNEKRIARGKNGNT